MTKTTEITEPLTMDGVDVAARLHTAYPGLDGMHNLSTCNPEPRVGRWYFNPPSGYNGINPLWENLTGGSEIVRLISLRDLVSGELLGCLDIVPYEWGPGQIFVAALSVHSRIEAKPS